MTPDDVGARMLAIRARAAGPRRKDDRGGRVAVRLTLVAGERTEFVALVERLTATEGGTATVHAGIGATVSEAFNALDERIRGGA